MPLKRQFATPLCKQLSNLVQTSQAIYRQNQINFTLLTTNPIRKKNTSTQDVLRAFNRDNNIANILNRAIIQVRKTS